MASEFPWDGYSRGTEDVMAKADARGKLKRVYNAEDQPLCGIQSHLRSGFNGNVAVWGCTKPDGHDPPHGHPWAGHTW